MEEGVEPHDYEGSDGYLRCIATNLRILNDNLCEFLEEMRKESSARYVESKGWHGG